MASIGRDPSQVAQCYRVKTPFVAVSPQAEYGFRSVELEPGTIIKVESRHTGLRSGLVCVVYDHMVLSSFLRDIEDNAELVDGEF